ncbi:MAG: serine hydrolase [Candidatus Omnitrophota bacterium]|nr:MAG: serine hydrolase [Candidatus Omnitrophota bacterium]
MRKKTLYIGGLICIGLSLLILTSYPKFAVYQKKKDIFQSLDAKITTQTEQLNVHSAILIQDLSFPYLSVACNEEETFPAASIVKLPILAVALNAVNEGRLSLSQKVVIMRKDVFGGSGVIKRMRFPVTLTVEKILELMITHSDNTATNTVIGLLGFEYINEGFKKLGLKNTTLSRKMMDFYKRKKGIENYTTAVDMTHLLETIYSNRLVNKKFSQYALSLLKRQEVNDRLPRDLPEGVEVAHKTGLEKGIVHDIGIVFTSRGDYIICVLTKKVQKHKNAKNFIAQISLLTYNLYQ